MTWTPTTPITGTAQTGLTSPTYTITADTAPYSNGKQYAVTALGGTQSGVNVTGASTPFTLSFFKPAVIKTRTLDASGRAVAIPMNVYKQVSRKAVAVDGAGGVAVALVTTTIEVPAGSESVDAINVRAMLSAHIGLLSQQSGGIGDTVVSGIF